MILVIAEQRGGKLNRATWEAIAPRSRLGGRRATSIVVAVLGSGVGASPPSWPRRRCKEVVAIEHAALDAYTPDGLRAALAAGDRRSWRRRSSCCRTPIRRATSRRSSPRGIDRALVTDVTAHQERRRRDRVRRGRCSRAS